MNLIGKKLKFIFHEQVEQVIDNYEIKLDEVTKKKILYYAERESLGYGKIDPLMT